MSEIPAHESWRVDSGHGCLVHSKPVRKKNGDVRLREIQVEWKLKPEWQSRSGFGFQE